MLENFKLFVNTFSLILFVILAILVIFQYQNIIRTNKKINRLRRRYDALFQSEESINIEELLNEQAKSIRANNKMVAKLAQEINEIHTKINFSIQKIGFHKYDAFEYLDNQLSFTLVFLDSFDNGILISSIFGEEQSNTFAKEVVNGKCTQKMSDDEKIALDNALSGGIQPVKKAKKG